MATIGTRILRGAIAGAAGTLAMDLLWWGRYRRGGGTDSFPAWEFAYGTLGALGIYEPIWKYEPRVVASDLRAHLLFGAATGMAHAALSGVE